MKEKKRLDLILQEQYPQYSRRQIQSWILQGKVKVDDKVITKSGTLFVTNINIVLDIEEPKFVSRAGYKLEAALDHFNIDVTDLVALDAGLSTGGFTDCLLQRGAKKICGVDVGRGLVHEKIRNDSRVTLFEDTNLRYLEGLDNAIDIVTLDLSFISVLKVMDVVFRILKSEGQLVILIKPQFEAKRDQVRSGGLVKDPKVHQEVIDNVVFGVTECGFSYFGFIPSPIKGATGNQEFLAYFKKI